MTHATALETLLLVEDDQLLGRALVRTLTASGYDVTHVDRGDVAVQCLRRESFDVVLSDLGLPGASGLEVLAQARASRPSTRLLLMSGAPTHESTTAAEELGVVAYLAKPLAKAELAFALQHASRGARPPRLTPDRRARDSGRHIAVSGDAADGG
jgi:DNA-binding response OmpR family regulator